jgi:hypothetical protein
VGELESQFRQTRGAYPLVVHGAAMDRKYIFFSHALRTRALMLVQLHLVQYLSLCFIVGPMLIVFL